MRISNDPLENFKLAQKDMNGMFSPSKYKDKHLTTKEIDTSSSWGNGG